MSIFNLARHRPFVIFAACLWAAAGPSFASKAAKRATMQESDAIVLIHEVLASLYASSVKSPSLAMLTQAALAPLSDSYTCFNFKTNEESIALSCNGQREDLPYPPRKLKEASQILRNAIILATRRQPVHTSVLSTIIESMIAAVADPYTAYIPPEQVDTLQSANKYLAAETGILLNPNFPTEVRGVDTCSYASLKGIEAGDQIIRIDGQETESRSFTELTIALLGADGSMVDVAYHNRSKQLMTTSVRREFNARSRVEIEILPQQIVYVGLSEFSRGVANEIIEEVWSFKGQGIILDLRGNSGGFLTEGISLLDLFFQSGPLGGVRPRPGRPAQDFVAQYSPTDFATPLIVLIDRGTASSSELVSMVLQDRKRALIMGTASMGKGSVQKTIALPNEGALKVTSAVFVGAKNQRLLSNGVQPDRVLSRLKSRDCNAEFSPKTDPWVIESWEMLVGKHVGSDQTVKVFGPGID